MPCLQLGAQGFALYLDAVAASFVKGSKYAVTPTASCCAVLLLLLHSAAELHVLDGAAQTIFVRANYSMEVRLPPRTEYLSIRVATSACFQRLLASFGLVEHARTLSGTSG